MGGLKIADPALFHQVGIPAPLRNAPVRVLLSAYYCAPGSDLLARSGWEWYWRLAQRLPVTLVTHVRNEAAIRAAGGPAFDTAVLYVDTGYHAGLIYRLAKRLPARIHHPERALSSLDQFVFDCLAVRYLRAEQRGGASWDLVHAVTAVSPAAAGGLRRLGLPVVTGTRWPSAPGELPRGASTIDWDATIDGALDHYRQVTGRE